MERLAHNPGHGSWMETREDRGYWAGCAEQVWPPHVRLRVRLRPPRNGVQVSLGGENQLRMLSSAPIARVWGWGQVEAASRVRGVVRHASQVQQPEQPSLPPLRRTRDFCVRAVVGFWRVLFGHGVAPIACSRNRPHRQQRPVLAGELPMGDCFRERLQQAQQRSLDPRRPNANDGAMVARGWNHGKATARPHQTRVVALRCADQAAEKGSTTGGVS